MAVDEPGGIFDELTPALQEAGFRAVEFRYPNDQAIDRSSELLADYWPQLSGLRRDCPDPVTAWADWSLSRFYYPPAAPG